MNSTDHLFSKTLQQCGGVCHGFYTRSGGVSSGDFDSLNCSFGSEDDRFNVSQNRKLVAQSLNCQKLVSLQQIHSADVHIVGQDFAADQLIRGDAMVTREVGIGLGVLGADCAPVLLADPDARVIGAAHAGWKGAVQGVTDSIIDAMEGLGAAAENIHVAVGPAIQKLSYEVGVDFKRAFIDISPIKSDSFFLDHNASVYFDLPGYIQNRLQNRGVKESEIINEDTYSQSGRFFSYRRMCHQKGQFYGRQIGAICLTEEF